MIDQRIEIIEGDITKLAVDAIVNAANEMLLGGGGVDGAIHRVAGPQLLEECLKIGGCPTGEARLTQGYHLPARYVIHTVGPIWAGGVDNEDVMLASAYRSSLALAVQNDIHSIAFPSISTGSYGFPMERAAPIALRTVRDFLATNSTLQRVIFVCFGEAAHTLYLRFYNALHIT
ncbi:MAG: O-acetyl-ADP-ribose deacetylase [Chloroflexi bacterium CFX4]|nr:O-acetyl-ADP-ribose deacetylase [Chloroflexi bacterium CFX4]MDL1923431.1 O-acetyl-ADP-ribose deacetylase [Chloroflexi bacterium CFX3]